MVVGWVLNCTAGSPVAHASVLYFGPLCPSLPQSHFRTLGLCRQLASVFGTLVKARSSVSLWFMGSTFLVTEARLGPFRIDLTVDRFSNRRFRARAGFDLKSFFAPGCLTLKSKWFQSLLWQCETAIFYPIYPCRNGGLFRSWSRVTFWGNKKRFPP